MDVSEKFTEREIVRRILDGEKALYEIIIRRFNPYLYKTGRSYNYNHDDTQALMEDTFVDAYKSLSQSEDHPNFKMWIIHIMLNNCHRKRKESSFKNEMAQNVNDNSKQMFSNPITDTDKIIQNREPGQIIEEALGKVPYDYRMVFSLREINGLNISETANLLSISEDNVISRLNRAKAMLSNEIDKLYSATNIFRFNLIYCDPLVENVMKRINKN